MLFQACHSEFVLEINLCGVKFFMYISHNNSKFLKNYFFSLLILKHILYVFLKFTMLLHKTNLKQFLTHKFSQDLQQTFSQNNIEFLNQVASIKNKTYLVFSCGKIL